MATPSGKKDDLLGRLRRELPRLLKERPEVRAEVAALLADHLTTREETNRILEEIRALREDSNRRFEELAREVRDGFKRADERFAAMDKRFEARFEWIDRRFESMKLQMEDVMDWAGVVVGGFQRRADRRLQDAVAGTLRAALRMRDLRPEDVRMRQKVTDADGLIGAPGTTYELDLLVHDGEAYVFEVKSVAVPEHAERLAKKARLAAKQLGRAVEPVLVTLDRPDEVVEACERNGVRLA